MSDAPAKSLEDRVETLEQLVEPIAVAFQMGTIALRRLVYAAVTLFVGQLTAVWIPAWWHNMLQHFH